MINYYELLIEDQEFQKWHDYLPQEPQYVKYAESNPSILAAARKIVDVYRAYADARALFLFANEDNYGDLAGEGEDNHLFVKVLFIKSAILQYGLCLDLCWQVVWAFLHTDSLNYLLNNNYPKLERQCTSNQLIDELKKRNSDVTVANLQIRINKLNCDPAIKALREQFRIMKHRGTIRVKGADDASEVTELVFMGKTINSDIRAEYDVEGLEKIIFDYHKSFFDHFTCIIEDIIPEDYFDRE